MAPDRNKKLNIIIAVLSILLAMSLTALVSLLLYNHSLQSALSSLNIAPDNIISATQTSAQPYVIQSSTYAVPVKATRMVHTTSNSSPVKPLSETQTPTVKASRATYTHPENVLELYNKNPQVNDPFVVDNMFPGDHIVKDYCIRVHHKGALNIYFRANIQDEAAYEKLAEVLKVKITVEGEERYDGLMRDMPASIAVTTPNTKFSSATEFDYEIDAYLDTSVGNDYKNKELVADFIWWANVRTADPDDYDDDKPVKPEQPDQPVQPDQPDQPDEPDDPTPVVPPDEPGEGGGTLVDPPQTGYELEDRSLMKIALAVSCGFLFCSSAVLFFLILTNEKKEEEDKNVR